jgi:hypothetical protein
MIHGEDQPLSKKCYVSEQCCKAVVIIENRTEVEKKRNVN